MSVVCIHQPDFAPWLGFFGRLIGCRLLVILDHVQFIKKGWHNRDRIKTANGPQWLTVPVRNKGNYQAPICEMLLDDDQPWRERHLKTISCAYGRSPYFASHFPEIEAIYRANQKRLVDFNLDMMKWMFLKFEIKTDVLRSSELPCHGAKTELLLSILKLVGGDTYVTGQGSRSYLDVPLLQKNGISVHWHEFVEPVYPQQFGSFVNGLSALDALFNCGPEARRLIEGVPVSAEKVGMT